MCSFRKEEDTLRNKVIRLRYEICVTHVDYILELDYEFVLHNIEIVNFCLLFYKLNDPPSNTSYV